MDLGYLLLEDGQIFEGKREGEAGCFSAEVVFTTGMCGYMESLTDPSFAGQILVFTYPLIGNYGIADPNSWESKKAHVAGVIVNENCEEWSHHSGLFSLRQWLHQQRVPLLSEVDTRALTKALRSRGTMLGTISDKKEVKVGFYDPNREHLVDQVSIKEIKHYGQGGRRVIAVDCGMKESMIRMLSRYPAEIVRVPHDFDYSQQTFDGVFLSNGPGDPTVCKTTISVLQKAMQKEKPIFGVCLGSQMLALAAGAKTFKLPFGHRGQNQPCIDLETGKCYITSQNHGFAVDPSTLPEKWKVTFQNLNDGSVEGLAHCTHPFFSVQFHPEASPGPTDTRWFFDKFWEAVEECACP